MSNEYIALYTDKDRASPWAHRVEIAFFEAGLQPVIGLVELQNKPQWFTDIINPYTKEVPSIAYRGPNVPADQPSSQSAKLTDSTVLLEFLADIYPSAKLLPTDAVQRAKARFFIGKATALLNSSWIAFLKNPASTEALIEGFEALQSLLPETGFAVGEWSIADASIAPGLGRVEAVLREDLGSWEKGVGSKMHKDIFYGEHFERLSRYWRDIEARESWQRTWDEASFIGYYRKKL
ncbi:unnamed protein product [Peniophora sp. CBMAI 1063]|nr:unnamed protein product [Peniophora sp. CBMAI 1063]